VWERKDGRRDIQRVDFLLEDIFPWLLFHEKLKFQNDRRMTLGDKRYPTTQQKGRIDVKGKRSDQR
jgi:hypothetical protein